MKMSSIELIGGGPTFTPPPMLPDPLGIGASDCVDDVVSSASQPGAKKSPALQGQREKISVGRRRLSLGAPAVDAHVGKQAGLVRNIAH
jgi:hypothetical protein